MRNLPLTFDYSTYGQKLGEDFAKFCGLLRIYELYNFSSGFVIPVETLTVNRWVTFSKAYLLSNKFKGMLYIPRKRKTTYYTTLLLVNKTILSQVSEKLCEEF